MFNVFPVNLSISLGSIGKSGAANVGEMREISNYFAKR